MKLTQKKIDEYNIELTVTEDAAEFSKAISRATKILGERVTIPGFRKGKVPAKILEQHLGKGAIVNEASEILIQKSTREALRILGLTPVSENKADVVTNEEGKDFVFTLTFTPFPSVELGEYKGLDAEKVVEPVTDDNVDAQVQSLRKHHANLIDAAEGDAIVDGDFITLDYTGTINGEKFAGGEAKDQPLEIGAHKFIGDFEEQLIGAKVGEELTVKVTFPDEYHAKDLAGRDAEFACKINSIKHRELPELDDEFIKKFTTFQTLDEYKADIRKNLETNAERRAVEAQRQAIIDKAVANMKVDLPPVMVETRVTQMIKDLGMQMQSQGMTLEQYMAFSGIDMEKMREDYREAAKKSVLRDIMLEQVAQQEKITVTDQELNYEIAMMAQMYRTPAKQIAKYLKENDQLSSVVVTILHRKAVKFIIDNSAIAVKQEVPSSEETKAAEVPKVAEPKVEAPAKETKAAEVPKVAEPKVATPAKETKAAEVPKVAEPKVATPAKETKAAEVPKVAEPKVETPAKETKAAEAPKVAEPKVEVPAKETKTAETPKVAEPKVEAPAKETKAAEAPKVAEPKVETPAKETKAAEVPKVAEPKVESPAKETKAAETPKVAEPKVANPAKETKED